MVSLVRLIAGVWCGIMYGSFILALPLGLRLRVLLGFYGFGYLWVCVLISLVFACCLRLFGLFWVSLACIVCLVGLWVVFSCA